MKLKKELNNKCFKLQGVSVRRIIKNIFVEKELISGVKKYKSQRFLRKSNLNKFCTKNKAGFKKLYPYSYGGHGIEIITA